MSELFASGRIIDFVLALMVLEGTLLAILRHKAARAPPLGQLFATLLSGAMLMLTLRAALTGADWQTLAALMVASLAAHLLDLKLRFN